TVGSGDITIDKEGIYVLGGTAENVTVYVDAGSEDKVQLVLDGLSISNSEKPCIYVKSADKVFITSVSDNSLSTSGTFSADGDTNTDAVIFSKDDLVLNGTGSLSIKSSDNGIAGKDSVKITGGYISIECEGSAVEAHDSILIAQGVLDITKCNDGLHADDDDDDSAGYIYIGGGSMNITAKDDAVHATTIVRIDNGKLSLSAHEGIEGTAIQVNDGTVEISASDDGINAARKSSALSPVFEMNGGTVTITMAAGDTDGVDSNGDIIINGGTISISGQSTFDCDGNAQYNGGTIIENGKETNTITNQMMGGPGNMGGMRPDGEKGGMMPGGGSGNGGGRPAMQGQDGMPPEPPADGGGQMREKGGRRMENATQ
ncbi:MAG: carbohydrate-binding domain-containing protein, partial [Lachnospiraceae bacterium]|nr:carbohydrate-binding domain-containing protein [Lachnospiraceae bacterium]